MAIPSSRRNRCLGSGVISPLVGGPNSRVIRTSSPGLGAFGRAVITSAAPERISNTRSALTYFPASARNAVRHDAPQK